MKEDEEDRGYGERTPAWIKAGRVRRMECAVDDADGWTEAASSADAIAARRRGAQKEEEEEEEEKEKETKSLLLRENARLRATLKAREGEFAEAWRAELTRVRRAVIERDAEWARRVDRYRKLASDARAAHELDKATWAVERASLHACDEKSGGAPGVASSSLSRRRDDAVSRLRAQVRAIARAHAQLRADAQLASRLIAPAVEHARRAVRDALPRESAS